MNNNISNKELLLMIKDELKIYVSLQQSVHEFYKSYQKEPSEVLKSILLGVINNAKEQNNILTDMTSKIYIGEEKEYYINMLSDQQSELQNIETELKKSSKTK